MSDGTRRNGLPGRLGQLTDYELAMAQAAQLGRSQYPEFFYSYNTPMTTGQVVQTVIPRPLNLARPLESITLRWSGRIVIGVQDYAAGVPEAPQTIIENITVKGTHVKYNNITPWNISGATAFALPRCFMPVGNDLLIGTVRSADPGMPFVQTVGLTQGKVGTYDVQILLDIPTGFFLGDSPDAKRANLPFLWRPQDWKNDLTLALTMGDQTSLGTLGANTTVTWTAFGSGAGQPLMEIFLNYSLLGDFRGIGKPAVIIRNERQANPYLTAVVAQQQLFDLQKENTANVIVKSGLALTGMTGGVNPYSSLSDVQLDATKLVIDNSKIRDTYRNIVTKNRAGTVHGTVIPQGYFTLPFIGDSRNPMTSLRGDRPDVVPTGARFALLTDVLTASANNKQALLQEYVLGGPYA